MSHLSHSDTIGAALARAARKYRGRTALIFGDRSWSYDDIDRAADNIASVLLKAGCAKGDRVAAFGRNSDAYLLTWFGCARAGLVHVPINYHLHGEALTFILRQSGARALVTDENLIAMTADLRDLPELAIRGTFAGASDLDMLSAAQKLQRNMPDVVVEGGDLAQIQYTSGTTAIPKGAMMAHRAILFEYMSCLHDLDYSADDRCLAALPLYHTAQMHCFSTPQMLGGALTVLIDGPAPAQVFGCMSRYRLNSLFAPPTVWINLLRQPGFDEHFGSLRKLYYGASIMPGPVLAEIRSRLPEAGVYNVYGQSEIGPVATVLSPSDHALRPLSVGRPVINVETRIVDADMNDVAPHEHGEIVHRSPQLLSGYWQRPDETEAAFRGGWFHSGDLGYADEEGYIYIVDRIRDVINTGGVLVAGREVEDALFTHPAVAEVAVIGLPDPLWIEAVTAIVVLAPDAAADVEELKAHARSKLAPHQLPKRIIFIDDLPRNASGKVLKRALREQFAA